MKKTYIPKTDKIDVKNAPESISEVDVVSETEVHIKAVKDVFKNVLIFAENQVADHDHTKLENISLFTRYLRSGCSDEKDLIRDINFFNDIHAVKERHHINTHVPEDIELPEVKDKKKDGN